jgi:hypothetical protein
VNAKQDTLTTKNLYAKNVTTNAKHALKEKIVRLVFQTLSEGLHQGVLVYQAIMKILLQKTQSVKNAIKNVLPVNHLQGVLIVLMQIFVYSLHFAYAPSINTK